MSMVSSPVTRPRSGPLLAVCISLLCLLPPILWLSQRFPNVLFEDDAYFYLQIAWRIGAGDGSTFDGLNVTNGYHLLWTGILAPLAWLAHALGLGKIGLVALTVATSLTLAVLSVWRTIEDPLARALGIVLMLLCGLTMESIVLAALLLVSASVIIGEGVRPPAWLMLASVLVPLARIDFCFVVPALALCERGHRPLKWRWLAVTVLGAAIGVALQLGLEQLLFGSWTSVSSAYKTDLARARGGVQLLTDNLAGRGNQLRLAALALLAVLALVPPQPRAPRRWLSVLVVVAPVAIHLLLSELRDWYVLASASLCLLFASRGSAPLRLRQVSFVGVAAALTLASLAYLSMMRADMARTARFIRDAASVLRPSDVIYQVDGAGFTGFWLSAKVVNGDGLVNSWAYRERQLNDQLSDYLSDIQARYVLTNEPSAAERLIDHHGLVVEERDVTLVLDTGATRHPHAHFKLFALKPTSATATSSTAR